MKISEKSPLGVRAYGFNMSRDLAVNDYPDYPIDETALMVEPDASSEQNLFDMVFSVDPITKLPSGDLAMLLSKNTHPDVKAFITTQLMNPTNVQAEASGKFSVLSDDDIVALSRDSNESLESYRYRVFEFLKANKSVDSQ